MWVAWPNNSTLTPRTTHLECGETQWRNNKLIISSDTILKFEFLGLTQPHKLTCTTLTT